MKRIAAILTSMVLVFSLAACGSQQAGTAAGSEAASAAQTSEAASAAQTKTEEQLLAEENDILGANDELWEKVFASMDKNVTQTTLSNNYGEFLMSAVDNAKDQFTEDELKTLTEGSEQIRDLEDQIQPLQEQYAALQPAGDGEDGGMNDAVPTFPTFTGKDLDGNDVDSSIFSQNAVTVVNFWFSGCKPCVGELKELEELSKTVREQGGELIGINTETLDGNADAIATAKEILESKGVTYRNIYFDSSSEAAKFALNIMAFPTTYVFDRNGNVVGEPLLGGIDNPSNLERLQQTIADAIAADASNAVSADAIPADALPAGAIVTGK